MGMCSPQCGAARGPGAIITPVPQAQHRVRVATGAVARSATRGDAGAGGGVELKVVQAMLGHVSVMLTADTYASLLSEMARQAAERTACLVLWDAGKVRHQVPPRGRPGLVLVPPRCH